MKNSELIQKDFNFNSIKQFKEKRKKFYNTVKIEKLL